MRSNTIDLQQQRKFYDKYWDNKEFLNGLKLHRANKILEYSIDAKKKFKNPKILDIGCGDGRFTSFLGFFGPTTGIELSSKAVENANKTFQHCKFISGGLLDMVFEEKFDLIVSQEVIEHVNDQSAFISKCKDLLVTGGFLIMTTPNKEVFDHMEGGNWSNQPIENIMSYSDFKVLVGKQFKILRSETIILNFGTKGLYKLINWRYFIGLFNKLKLKRQRERLLGKLGFGLHSVVLAQKTG